MILRNAWVVTCDDAGTEHEQGWLRIEDGLVAEVGAGEPPRSSTDQQGEDLHGAVVTPGLVNTHHHLYQTLTRARAQEADLFTWLKTLYPVWARLDDEMEHAAAHGDPHGMTGQLAVITAVLATIGALFSYMGGATQADAALAKNTAGLLKTEANDQWNFYQAKNLRQGVAELGLDVVAPERRDQYAKAIAKYKADKQPIMDKAQELEKRSGARATFEAPAAQRAVQRPVAVQRSLVRSAIALLLAQPGLAERVERPYGFLRLDKPGVELLAELIDLARSRPGINPASLVEHYTERPEYPALQKLLLKGWVKASPAISGTGRAVREYKLTPAGRKQLELERANYRRVTAAIGAVLDTA